MPSVLGQVGQNVANNLFEIGQSVVKNTAGAVTDIASGSLEQIVSSPSTTKTQYPDKMVSDGKVDRNEQKRIEANQRYQEVRAELATYAQRKKELDEKIALEKKTESQQANQNDFVEKKKKDNWVSKLINRSQTGTERGRMSE